MSIINRYFQTIRHLKAKQIYYRFYFFIISKIELTYQCKLKEKPQYINMQPFPNSHRSIIGRLNFEFLNQQKVFPDRIDWNYSELGKLWTYHLNYFDFAHQENIDDQLIKVFINDYMVNYESIKDGREPYPCSLRIINLVKFYSQYKNENILIDEWIAEQALSIKKRMEYHIMGNHLLENAFALIFAAYHLQDDEFWHSGQKVLIEELEKQILKDGGHIERSPMYHSIILGRLLDTYNLMKQNPYFDSDRLKSQIKDAIERMLSWMFHMIQGKDIMMLNDSFPNQAIDPYVIDDYAKSLGLTQQYLPLSDSGYIKLRSDHMTCLFDAGAIGPDYQPGHAHADTLQFLLWMNHKEVITEAGTSVYINDEVREYERSSAAHNTVVVNGINSSDVWSTFRVGRRANVKVIKRENQLIEASHDGYHHLGAKHQRHVELVDDELLIYDTVITKKSVECKAYLHFHPDESPKVVGATIELKSCIISIEKSNSINLLKYHYSKGYNKRVIAIKAEIDFASELLTIIKKRE